MCQKKNNNNKKRKTFFFSFFYFETNESLAFHVVSQWLARVISYHDNVGWLVNIIQIVRRTTFN